MNKFIGGIYIAFVSALAILMVGAFIYADNWMPKTPPEITLKDNFNQVAYITAGVGEESGSGSGVLVDPWGVLTACHVVMKNQCQDLYPEPNEHIIVVVAGRTFFATVKKFDPYSDLAYLDLNTVLGVSKATYADGRTDGADPVTVSCGKLTIDRSEYYGIGHPFNMEKSIRIGVLSAESPSFATWMKLTTGAPWVHELYSGFAGQMNRERKYFNQFDMTLFPGNSGGGIFDSKGHLVGIVSHITKFPEELPVQGPDKRAIGVPSGFSYSTKPERICEFLNTVPAYTTSKAYEEELK